MEKFIPLLMQDNIPYIREERSGFFTILLKDRIERNVQLVNATAKFIMDHCNGANSVEDIVARLAEKYPETPGAVLREDVLRTLRTLDDLGLLSWEGGSPFKRSVEGGAEGDRVYRAEEGDFGRLCELIGELGICDLPLKDNDSIIYMNPFVMPRLYDGTVLRPRFFNHQEDFFILARDDGPLGFISVMNSRPLARIAQVTLLAVGASHEPSDVEKLVSSAVRMAGEGAMLTKLKWFIPSEDLSMIDLVKRLGFRREATLCHEIDRDRHVDIYSMFFV